MAGVSPRRSSGTASITNSGMTKRQMIETSPFFFIGTSWNDYIDCNIKSGDPGFVKVVGPNIIEYPEYDGNSMYRTLGNISRNPNVGLLFVRFDGKSRRMRVNGRASILDDADAIGRHFGAQLVVRIECEIYPNCPRYVPDLAGAKLSPYVPREGQGPPPPPEWKQRDYIRDILPERRSACARSSRRRSRTLTLRTQPRGRSDRCISIV